MSQVFTCAPRIISLAEAQKLAPHLTRAIEVRVKMDHAFAPLNDMPCWQWTGWLDEKGYGRMAYEGQASARVHRVTYQIFRGGLLETHVLDHRCRNRPCCNPWHLQAVTQTVNTQRGARADGMCRNGLHRMEGSNVIVRYRGGLPRYECAQCKRDRRPEASDD